MTRRLLLLAALLGGTAFSASAAAQQPVQQLQLDAGSKELLPAKYTFTAPLPLGLAAPKAMDGGHGVVLSRHTRACTTTLLVEAVAAKTGSGISALQLARRLRRDAARAHRRRPSVLTHVSTPVLPFASVGTVRNDLGVAALSRTRDVSGLVTGLGGTRVRSQFAEALVVPLDAKATPGQRALTLLLIATATPHSASCAALGAKRGARASAAIIAGARLTQSG